MKKTFYSDIYNIKVIEDPTETYKILKEADKILTTYNQLMSHYENGSRDIGVIFITSKDSIVFQHLPLFCNHFDIELYSLPNGSEDVLSSIFGKKYVTIVCLYKDTPSYQKFKQLDIKSTGE